MRKRFIPYKYASKSCRVLRNTFDDDMTMSILNRSRGRVNNFSVNPTDLYINWGTSTESFHGTWTPFLTIPIWINSPDFVTVAADKLKFFQYVETFWPTDRALQPLEYTDNTEVIRGWLENGHDAVLRWHLRGKGGAGIQIVSDLSQFRDVMIEGDNPLNRAAVPKLATKYFKKKNEYRVHVMDGEVLDIQQKKHRNGVLPTNFKVRSYNMGWIFCRDGVSIPDNIKQDCVDFVKEFGLEFGALDILHNEHYNRWAIAELNTAPGLEGTTLDKYHEGLSKLFTKVEEAIQSNAI
jgi:glutathione synthase/RimK-type ligase-like ATP-grasp enzyme